MVAYVRTVKTGSGATAVQIVWSSRRGSRSIEHVGSAHDEAGVAALRVAAEQRMAAGQQELDLGVAGRAGSAPLPITSSRAAHLWDALCQAYRVLGFDAVGDEVFRQLVCARIIEPTSKIDSARVLNEAGIAAASHSTINRRLPLYAKDAFRQQLSTKCAAHAELGPATLVLYDVTVRREALVVRMEVKDLHQELLPKQGFGSRGQPGRGDAWVGGSSPDKAVSRQHRLMA